MLPKCWRNTSWTACWWGERRSIPAAGRNLCALPQPRYLAPRMYGILVGILILDSLILATAVLLQAGQGGGLAPIGGGGGAGKGRGSRRAATLLNKVTWWTARAFLFLPLLL